MYCIFEMWTHYHSLVLWEQPCVYVPVAYVFGEQVKFWISQ